MIHMQLGQRCVIAAVLCEDEDFIALRNMLKQYPVEITQIRFELA